MSTGLRSDDCSREVDSGGVAGVCLVVTSGNGPELLQRGEGVLDEVAPAVHVAVEVDGGSPVSLGRDHRGGPAIVQVRPEPVRIERFVAEQSPEGDALDQRPHADTVVVLAGQQDETHQVTKGVDTKGVDTKGVDTKGVDTKGVDT